MRPDQKKHFDEILKEIARGDYDKVDYTGKVVLDIGAYFGETAKHFVSKGAKLVYAIEPFDSVNAIPITKQIKPIRAGIGVTDGFETVDYSYNTGDTRFTDRVCGTGKKVVVYSLETLTDQLKIIDGILKIDIEGDEIFLLSVSEKTLQKFECIIVEVHKTVCEDISLDLLAFLTMSGFTVNYEHHGKNVGMLYAFRN